PLAQDEWDTGERLDVVYNRRTGEETRDRWEGRFDSWKTLSAFERRQQGRFLAADICSGAAVDHDVQVEAGPLDVLAEPARPISLVNSPLHPLCGPEVLTANVYVGFVTSNGVCCDESAFEQRMRVPLQNVPVLESPGFAFVRVDDQILWLWRLLGD